MNFKNIVITPSSLGKTRRETLHIAQWLYNTSDIHQVSKKKVGSYSVKLYHPYRNPREFKKRFFDRFLRKTKKPSVVPDAVVADAVDADAVDADAVIPHQPHLAH